MLELHSSAQRGVKQQKYSFHGSEPQVEQTDGAVKTGFDMQLRYLAMIGGNSDEQFGESAHM